MGANDRKNAQTWGSAGQVCSLPLIIYTLSVKNKHHFFRATLTKIDAIKINNTVEPHYNEVLGTMKVTLLPCQVSHYIRVKKQRNIKSWDQQNYLVIRGFCYIRPLYNEVPLYLDTNKL